MFRFKYETVVSKPNPMRNFNPLARASNRVVGLEDRITELRNSKAWQRTVNAWKDIGRTIDQSKMPKVEMIELGVIAIDEDIQRKLDEKHCANRIGNVDLFNEPLLQTLQCIKTSKGQFVSIDGQHTATTLGALIEEGFFVGIDDWRKFKFPVQYIETDDLAFARRAFSILNGKGKKRQSAWDDLRNSVFIVRIDKNFDDEDDVKVEQKVSIAESYDCYPVEEKNELSKYPGTFTNIANFVNQNDETLHLACKWHNQYFHYLGIHVSLFFMYQEFQSAFKSARLPVSDKLQEELAALIQQVFVDLDGYAEAVKEAWRKWSENRYGDQTAWRDDGYAVALLQLYKKFGGEERVPLSITDRYDDLYKFFADEILDMVA